jgi:hypothetical protein
MIPDLAPTKELSDKMHKKTLYKSEATQTGEDKEKKVQIPWKEYNLRSKGIK